MKQYGLLGFPLGHSFSKSYFEGRLNYNNFQFPTVEEFFSSKPADLAGFNVTIPYKQAIIPHLDELSLEAQQIGAVNCVKINNNTSTGYNTDVYGFEISLLELIGNKKPEALILGDGGAAKAVKFTLAKLSIPYLTVSRASQLNYSTLTSDIVNSHKLIINTTPLGMYPATSEKPNIDYCAIGKNHYLYDLVYNPAQTTFLAMGRKQGAAVMNGLKMLQLQAEKSYQIWTSDNL